MHGSRKRAAIALAASAAIVGAGATLASVSAHAAGAGCSVSYTVSSQWQGGFTTNIILTNLGDPLTGWTVNWSFAAGQQITQAWNIAATQNGPQVTATNLSYNASLATGGTASFGFNGSWNNTSNPDPATFTMNGIVCTGGVTTPPPTTTSTTPPPPPSQAPCDIYAAGGTPCVAAHSTTRALFGGYNGRLYQVRRSSDNTTRDIGTVSTGGVANAAAQDSFCAGTSCVITIIYDQTSRGNNLTQAPAGGAAGGPDNLANATAAQTTLNGQKVYGVFVAPGTGYRNDATSGIATGAASQGEYMVAAGGHVNSGCCFDYGNAESNARDNGNGHMGAVYFGKLCWFGFVVPGQCVGSGPWVMADLENGLFAGANGTNTNNTGRSTPFVTGMVKMNSTTYAIKDADANTGGLKTDYNGPLPTTAGYTPLHLEGGIILGIGGDNSKGSAGTFFEGVMTTGFPSDATENAVQANITAAGYGH